MYSGENADSHTSHNSCLFIRNSTGVPLCVLIYLISLVSLRKTRIKTHVLKNALDSSKLAKSSSFYYFYLNEWRNTPKTAIYAEIENVNKNHFKLNLKVFSPHYH